MFDFEAFKKSVTQLQTRLADIREQIDELQRQRNRIAGAPAARSDVKQMLERWVDASAAGFVPAMSQVISEFVRRPQLMIGDKWIQSKVTLHSEPLAGSDLANQQVDRVLCALFGLQIKRALAEVVDKMEWPKDGLAEGLPLAERDKQLAALDAQLEALHREESELREKAGDAGLIV